MVLKSIKKSTTAALLFALSVGSGQLSAQKIPAEKSDAIISKLMYPALEELKDYVSIPNDALVAEDIDKNLAWSEKAFAKRGFKTDILKTGKLPLFSAEKTYPKNTKTVLFYFHLDGQAVRPTEWFQKDPYMTVLKEKSADGSFKEIDWNLLKDGKINDEWRIFARSTSDDKGPIVMLLQALDILAAQKQQPPFNVKVVLDCEEEKGSPGLKAALAEYKTQLMADFLIVMDGPMHATNRPTLTFGCRGGTGFSLTTYGAITQQHSGHFGNYSPDPTFSLAKIISTMKDDDGRVLVDGFYDGIKFDAEAVKLMAAVPDNLLEINDRLQIAEAEKVGKNYQESMQYPSLNIRGLKAAVTGKGGGSIIPEEALAEFGIRLVPETEGAHMTSLVKKHIEKQGYTVVDHVPTKQERMAHKKLVFMSNGGAGSPAFRTEVNSPIGNWLRKSVTENFTEQPVIIRIMGGSVPVVPFIQTLGVPAVIVPMVNMDNNQHSPNENLRIGNLRMGIKTCLSILTTPI
ncbi:M20/M25/M40 family metallo-hydrolase [Dyadobacter frigoris]|uniref:M20/M25/M40 family metallo-hydrolase n=1 Tax=Dyadobacter frigoris TaxID=2576211 RepID=A0A4V6BIJ0_9BACT|nr:M20/M25/M40 family metallo-hydrolase [Dyadobacter frigoris]TKT90533.1 M20/M25/M40 family metallo-hydrolase [Dyadobacter frigoris]GLU51329.1 peptidase M20 [Dyadobacter frigoris]